MRTRKIIFIDGIKTREEVDKKAGRKRGMVDLCKQLGVSQPVLSEMCINGYGTEKTVRRYMDAGVPIVISQRPITSRTAKAYKKGKNRMPDPEAATKEGYCLELRNIDETQKQQLVETIKRNPPHQISIEDITGAEQIKELLISHLTALIEDLKNL